MIHCLKDAKSIIVAAVFVGIVLLNSCGSMNNLSGENYGDIAGGPGGITLTEAEHPVGWKKANCFECHNNYNIHQQDRTGTGLNLQAIRAMTEEDGLESCPTCHGTNGIE